MGLRRAAGAAGRESLLTARIAIIDLEMGNLASVERALRHVGPELVLVRANDPGGLAGADAVVLPGVGAFAAAMDGLRRKGLVEPLRQWLRQGRPLLGICLGFQLLFEASEEVAGAAGETPRASGSCPPGPETAGSVVKGLGWFSGRVRRFPAPLTVPHMGWNRLHFTGLPCRLLEGVEDGSYVYFAHSYYPDGAAGPQGEPAAVAVTRVAGPQGEPVVEFVAAAWRGMAGGVQFHPEKSGRVGLQILRNFVRLALEQAQPARVAAAEGRF